MRINKIRVQNYKLLKDVCIPVNQDLNVFVGENDAGKSTLLEVISIIASGKLNGYAFNKQIKDNMFNMDVRNAYIASLSGTPIEPPVIVMEAYCSDKTAPQGQITLWEKIAAVLESLLNLILSIQTATQNCCEMGK